MKTVAYLRVSTAQQDVRSQRLAILEHARKHDFRIDDFIEATASGQASEKRRRLDELMNVLQRGDRLVVSELSRLGRSLGQIVAILNAFAKADLGLHAPVCPAIARLASQEPGTPGGFRGSRSEVGFLDLLNFQKGLPQKRLIMVRFVPSEAWTQWPFWPVPIGF